MSDCSCSNFAFASAISLALSGAAEAAPKRVASLNLCTDELLLMLADPRQINVGLVGIGNCASSLVQGIAHYQNGGANEQIGLMPWALGAYRPDDIRVGRHRHGSARPRLSRRQCQ